MTHAGTHSEIDRLSPTVRTTQAVSPQLYMHIRLLEEDSVGEALPMLKNLETMIREDSESMSRLKLKRNHCHGAGLYCLIDTFVEHMFEPSCVRLDKICTVAIKNCNLYFAK